MKIVFFGTPEFAVPTLEKLLLNQEFEVLAVVTQPDKRRERGNKLTPSPVKNMAIAHDLPVWQPERIKKDTETLNKLKQLDADAFVVVAYGQILSQKILDMPKLGCVNVHGSILPQYRGAAPIQWCLYNGETETGITTMLMDAGMDTGAMLLKATTPIGLLDNADDVAQRLSVIGGDLLIETLYKLQQQEIQPIPQDNAAATYASLIQKQDYGLDWSRSALQLHNQIRGFYPNCTTTFRNQPLKITASFPLGAAYNDELPPELQKMLQKLPDLSQISGSPGEVVSITKGVGAIAQTGEGLLLLREVQLPGKRPQSGWDFVNGTRLTVGEVLGNGS
ncbi:methionyl-tRNA formyltransferase [Trichormus variabilis ATCC 29413]|uniref:Methionyl-tRNA formyltransferase n=2 Tax=Anabaena variabilis TaxID=264691 RepID=FMT_TRIV2|nr:MULTISPECIES: methionyl-tRNA formyltransferase [Nostocaceae]Q3M7E8.1 RecName: Full=Methionyl-tRNA formyltransferase [Trichormus variabilis ATCC 29413]ABA23088.1 methionyl-tRNA formyltransferase [Trichormus variabilis ATCC 29413]MBC1216014.1 methionyl-tRNA formyltransferase [Trichormus variabilis ARAD]MBC1255361.1 methionyl-tRNA formyltransferase [Trichormus variabilis V5]MBC1265710.1 methionyl-tRNA formyltransferase [Trichormus variabilis FSR]MBC1303463.1 methionyl-tRNA formyltransferase [